MDTAQALKLIGAHPGLLTEAEKQALDNDGYVVLRNILSPEQIQAIKAREAQLHALEGDKAGLEVHQEKGTDRLANLLDKGPEFHVVLTQPRVVAAIAYVLDNDLKFSACNTRTALPGQGTQVLHSDWPYKHARTNPNEFFVCNSLWMLDDFTPENGATRVVPGTHRSLSTPDQEMGDANSTHPREKLVLGKAGDVAVVNSHTWHGGTLNTTGKTRSVLSGYYCKRHLAPLTDHRKFISPAVAAQFPPHLKFILDID